MTFDLTISAGPLAVKFEFADFTQTGWGTVRLEALVTITSGQWRASHKCMMFGSEFAAFGQALLAVHDEFNGDIELRPKPAFSDEFEDLSIVLSFSGERRFALSGFIQTYAFGVDDLVEGMAETPTLRMSFASEPVGYSDSFVGELLDILSMLRAHP